MNKNWPPKAEHRKDDKTQVIPPRIKKSLGNLALSFSLLTGSACSIHHEVSDAGQEWVEDQNQGPGLEPVNCNPRLPGSESPFIIGDNPEGNATLTFLPGIKPLADKLRLTDFGWYMLHCGQPEIVGRQEAEELCPNHSGSSHCYDYRFEPIPNPVHKWEKINIPRSETKANQEMTLRHGLLHLIYDYFYQLGAVNDLNRAIQQAAEINPEIEAQVTEEHPAASWDTQKTYGRYLLMSELHSQLLESGNLPEALGQHYDQYFQGSEIDNLANRIGLTRLGRDLLDEVGVRIFTTPEHGDYTCGEKLDSGHTAAGCYEYQSKLGTEGDQDIDFIYSGEVKLLDGPSIEVSLAHELLHVVYNKYFNQGDIERINQLVEEGFDHHPDIKQLLIEELGIKESLLHSEGYAYLAHHVRELPPGLEASYSLFFEDRQVLVDYHQESID